MDAARPRPTFMRRLDELITQDNISGGAGLDKQDEIIANQEEEMKKFEIPTNAPNIASTQTLMDELRDDHFDPHTEEVRILKKVRKLNTEARILKRTLRNAQETIKELSTALKALSDPREKDEKKENK